MLSYTFLMETGKQDIVVPMIHFEKRGEEWVMMPRSSANDWKKNMDTLVRWSPYSSEEHLMQQCGVFGEEKRYITDASRLRRQRGGEGHSGATPYG
ncbi:hypothetical protein Tco_1012813 [Tanacetum coccineum]